MARGKWQQPAFSGCPSVGQFSTSGSRRTRSGASNARKENQIVVVSLRPSVLIVGRAGTPGARIRRLVLGSHIDLKAGFQQTVIRIDELLILKSLCSDYDSFTAHIRLLFYENILQG
jgi:hypothetical protein